MRSLFVTSLLSFVAANCKVQHSRIGQHGSQGDERFINSHAPQPQGYIINGGQENQGRGESSYYNSNDNGQGVNSKQQHQHQYGHGQEKENTEAQLNSCFSRLRLAAAFDSSIAQSINKYISSSRIDLLKGIVEERAQSICSQVEQIAVLQYFKQHHDAIAIANKAAIDLSDSDKDRLNTLQNFNDSLGEQIFYQMKFMALPLESQQKIQRALSDITRTLSSPEPQSNLSRAMGSFTKEDIEKLKKKDMSSLPDEVSIRLKECGIEDEATIHDTTRLVQALVGRAHNQQASTHFTTDNDSF